MARRPAADGARVLGLDIGATKVSAGMVRPNGRLFAPASLSVHENDGVDGVLAELVEVGRRSLGRDGAVDAIGIGVAGQVETVTGTVRYAPNLAWRNVPLGRRIATEFGCPVVVRNDVQAAAMGEWRFGAGVGARNLLCIWIGTGVGGSLIHEGRLLEGASNALGEIGHTPIVVGGRACHCPARGCLEAYVGGWAIAERARERIRTDPQRGAWLVERAGTPEDVDARTVTELAHAGDPLATEILRVTGSYLASGVVGLVNAFNPDRVVLGGGVIDGWPEVVPRLRERVRSDCQPPAARAAKVVRSALGKEAILVGAAVLARERIGVGSPEPGRRRATARGRTR